MSFASHHPDLVNSIVLLGPAGILRYLPSDYENPCFRYPSSVPKSYLRRLLAALLEVDMRPTSPSTVPTVSRETEMTLNQPQSINAGSLVQWQFDYHQGFMHSFIDTVRFGPLMHQQETWKNVSDSFKGLGKATLNRNRLTNGKLLIIFGESDSIVVEKHVAADAAEIFGGEKVEVRRVPGGHGFPIPSADKIVSHLRAFWQLSLEHK